ncbi:MAG: DUF2523 domain-containing protein [Comamonas sp.]|nr:DUF2523 domain-containing protein [Comamonas sp.]
MQVLIASIWGGFLAIVQSIVGRVLLALGMGVITYYGFGSVINDLTSMGRLSLTSLPNELKQIFGLMRIGEIFSLYVSTVTIKLLYNGVTGGSITRIGSRAKGG